jgi:hypothetical protein
MAGPQLPQHTVLDIIYFCGVPTLKCLRLAHRSICDLIDTYQISISLNALDLFFEKEEVDIFRLLYRSHPPILALFFLEYRVRTAKWLVAIAHEYHEEDSHMCHPNSYGNIGANESQGDPVRGYTTVSCSVLCVYRTLHGM